MNGGHDLGGMHGLGPIAPEQDEPVFHAAWERRCFAITLAAGFHGRWSIDRSRFAREDRHPVDYLSSSYYELWQKALERLTVESGLIEAGELAAGRAAASHAQSGAIGPEEAARRLAKGGPTNRALAAAPRFTVGERVRVREAHPTGHTRAPRYCRGRIGAIESRHGGHVFPDASARGDRDAAAHLYTVAFAATELWGLQAQARDRVLVDLWEPYLEAAS
jgi:nitrile hydratase